MCSLHRGHPSRQTDGAMACQNHGGLWGLLSVPLALIGARKGTRMARLSCSLVPGTTVHVHVHPRSHISTDAAAPALLLQRCCSAYKGPTDEHEQEARPARARCAWKRRCCRAQGALRPSPVTPMCTTAPLAAGSRGLTSDAATRRRGEPTMARRALTAHGTAFGVS